MAFCPRCAVKGVRSNKVRTCDLSTAWNVFWRDGLRNSQVCATERGEFLMAFSRPKIPKERAALQRVREKKAERKLSEKFTKKANERERFVYC